MKLAAEVQDFDPTVRVDKREARKMARFTQFAVAAAEEAMEDSGLDLEHTDTSRFATIISSGIGGLPTIEEEHAKGEANGFDRVSPFFCADVHCQYGGGPGGHSLRSERYVYQSGHGLRRRHKRHW